ncbi:MAG TPA: GTPase, partial [Clostridiales bacterium]|nr:GTPase [Clostridiales bacterium]
EIDDDYIVKAHGLDKLIQVMGAVLDKELLSTLYNVQKASIAAKVKHAQGIVTATVAAGFTEGFTPVPFADAALLIPTQVAMIASITAVFGLQINRGIITAFIYSALGTSGATVTGRAVVSNLLKLIPGAGQIVGGLISGSTAAVITKALGNAYIKLMEGICKGELKESDLNSESAKERFRSLFHQEKENRKKSG